MSVENPSHILTYQVYNDQVVKPSKAGHASALVQKHRSLHSTKIDSHGDLESEVNDFLQRMSIELKQIQQNNMFQIMQSITRDELIHVS